MTVDTSRKQVQALARGADGTIKATLLALLEEKEAAIERIGVLRDERERLQFDLDNHRVSDDARFAEIKRLTDEFSNLSNALDRAKGQLDVAHSERDAARANVLKEATDRLNEHADDIAMAWGECIRSTNIREAADVVAALAQPKKEEPMP